MSGEETMVRCEFFDSCSFFSEKMKGLPSIVSMMREIFCDTDNQGCARYKLRKKILEGYTLPEDNTLHLGDTFVGNLEAMIENLYPNDHEKLERILMHLIK